MTEASRYHKIDHLDPNADLNRNNSYAETGKSSPSSPLDRTRDNVVFAHHDPLSDDDSTRQFTEQEPQTPQHHYSYSTVDSMERRWAVALFSITTVLLFADQNLMSPNLTAIARYFDFDDRDRDKKLGGDIALAFFVIGAPASFIVGSLGDSYNRSHLFALSVGIAEGSCLATFFVTTYTQFYLCRAITGFGLGGALPLIFSVLGDLYTAQDRHFVNAIVGIGTGVGISLGQGIAGFLGPTFGWRLPFLIISVPALICAALVLFTVQDPERGAMEETVLNSQQQETQYADPSNGSLSVEMAPLHGSMTKQSRPVDGMDTLPQTTSSDTRDEKDAQNLGVCWHTFCSLISTPTVVLSLLQGAPGCVPWGIVNSFLNDYLAEDRGMTVEVCYKRRKSHWVRPSCRNEK